MVMVGQEGIEKIDQQSLVGFGAKDALEAEVSKEADISVWDLRDHSDREPVTSLA